MKFRWPFWHGYIKVSQPAWEWKIVPHVEKRGGYVIFISPRHQLTLGVTWWSKR